MVYATLVFLNTLLIPYLFWSEFLTLVWEKGMEWMIKEDPYLSSMILEWGFR